MKKPRKIFRPCDCCVHEKNCELIRGCWQWRVYFRAYWSELRRKYYRRRKG